MSIGVPESPDEAQRLLKVAELCPYSTDSDEVFDRIVAMTADFFGAPIALITILDDKRQWYRARVGIDATESPRSVSFCAHSIFTKAFLEVPDATKDSRFNENPLVTGPPYIRYYAGAPLITEEGLSLGSLCIIDTEPRQKLSSKESAMLSYFAELVMMRIVGLRSRSFIDQPTGLFNRLRLEEDIRGVLLSSNPCQLVAIDVVTPGFLNDMVKALGYSFAQDLIIAIKQRIQLLLPEGTLLYKVSPTRFGFISPGITQIDELCEPIVEDFNAPVVCRGIPLQMQVGVGVLPLLDESQLSEDWLRLVVSAADQARDRKIGWAAYEARFDAAHQRAFMLLSSLSNALNSTDQLSLLYQPQIEIQSGKCKCVEALLRWNHPKLGPISPVEFIPLAQKTALMQPLSEWVLREVIRQAVEWKTQNIHLRIAMNVTVSDLETPHFVDTLIALLQRHELKPSNIEIEFTESEIVIKEREVSIQLNRLREIGIEISIDDFGTGYSNWIYLRQLPASIVKVDQSLTRNLDSDEKNQRLVKTLIELAIRLGYRVVAEGVETLATLQLITKWGCTDAQGYLFAKPMSAEDLARWLA
ncbi:sensor domain-containing phosphodiesterase [Pseudomonas protegens]|uniref:sensor domain-containing phosphodiesterase n=1 Tax=Pseudomonas protegens TaxID=380021 RepID=UPI001F36152F|nr:GGDEF and EAL domain-containing protein [Pseudomonas protegens]